MEDNSHAGQGAVMLDIGGDIGALVVEMPAAMEGIEIEIRPIDDDADSTEHEHSADHAHSESDTHGQHDGHDHEHSADDEHGHSADHEHSHDGPKHLIHVAVVGRPAGGEVRYSAVYSELKQGTYELYERPAGPVRLTATVRGGAVTEAVWPD